MYFLMGGARTVCIAKRKLFATLLNPFLRAQKNLGLLFAFRARASKQANAHVHFERERKKQDDRKGGTREYSKEVLKKNPLRILSVNRASPADDIAVENAVDNKNFARTRTS